MAKLDKETMKKQHFWLLLIPLFIGLLLAWLGLFFGVADATEEKAANNDKERKAVEGTQAKSKKTLQLYDERKEKLFQLRTQRWKEMWGLQQAIYVWPDTLDEGLVAKVKDLKFGAEISDPQFINNFRDQGMEGYKKLAETIAPIQFAGDWRTALRTVPAWRRNPESEDIWLATEDYWVQRELLLTLAGVNKDAGSFKRPSDFPENDPRHALKNDPKERTFIGRTWQLDLKLTDEPAGPTVRGSITNLTGRLQPFNATNELLFNVWLSEGDDVKPFLLSVEGTTLEGGKKEPIKNLKKHTVVEGRAIELFKVEQVFDVRTAPVKRVDRVALGYTSARHSQAELQMPAFSAKAVEAEAATTGAAGGPAGAGAPPAFGSGMGPPPGMGGPPPRGETGPPGFGGPAGAAASTDLTYNGLARRRYVNLTGQVRAMPVGLVVVSDQAFVQDVLTAVANSRLRFQTVQTTLSRFRGSLSYVPQSIGGFGPGAPPMGGEGTRGEGSSGPPPAGPPPAGPPPGAPPRPGAPGRGFGVPPGVLPGVPGGFGGMPGFYGGAPMSSSDDQTAGNLIEIAVYGIASLYEKFDPAEPKKDDAAAPPTPGTVTAPPAPGPGTTTTTVPPGPMPPAPGAATTTTTTAPVVPPMTPVPMTPAPGAPATPAPPVTPPKM